MNVVSGLFARDFTGQIREWCGKHGVKVIGHVVEDNGAHARVGYGPGHYFRSMEGFDAAGLDIVYHVWPEYKDGFFDTPFGYLDAAFFYWGIAKMASSAAHLDLSKKGITMCEIFGAYGWQEGLKLMKWLTDHVCVRGVNMLVPHAFSPKYPDADCPPHFYARGKNPQWKYFRRWADYANRVCTLLQDGVHRATAGVLYHAEAEWGGDYQPFERVVRALAEAQIDCDVLPADCLVAAGKARPEGGKLRIGREDYQVLLIPYAQCLPEKLLQALDWIAESGTPVVFMDGYPEHVYYTEGIHALQEALNRNPRVEVCSLEKVADWMNQRGFRDICVRDVCPNLRCMHYEREEGSVYFFTNESKWNTIDTIIKLRERSSLAFYDAMEDVCYELPEEREGAEEGTVEFRLVLEPYQSVFVVPREQKPLAHRPIPVLDAAFRENHRKLNLAEGWRISVRNREGDLEPLAGISELVNLAVEDILPEYSGEICYEIAFQLGEGAVGGKAVLDLGEVYEISEVELNGRMVGNKICPPHVYELECREGRNQLRVMVTNTFAKEQIGNGFDRAMPQEPSGLLGPVSLYS